MEIDPRYQAPSNPIPLGGIIAAFIFVQPLAIVLLGLRKLYNRKTLSQGARTMLILAIVFGTLYLLMLSDGAALEGNWGIYLYMLGAPSVLSFAVWPFLFRLSNIDKRYIHAVTIANLTDVADIAKFTQRTETQIMNDLQKLIELKVFPYANLDRLARTFSLRANDPHLQNAPAPQTRACVCPGCGAASVATEGKASMCEYCGTPVVF